MLKARKQFFINDYLQCDVDEAVKRSTQARKFEAALRRKLAEQERRIEGKSQIYVIRDNVTLNEYMKGAQEMIAERDNEIARLNEVIANLQEGERRDYVCPSCTGQFEMRITVCQKMVECPHCGFVFEACHYQ